MDFRAATEGIPADELARAFRVSPQTVRQYRLDPSSLGFRSPPADWRDTVIGVLANRVDDYRDRIDLLRSDPDAP